MSQHFLILFFLLSTLCQAQVNKNLTSPELVTKIAFGSCAHQNKDLPILNNVLSDKPDIFIWTGDNIYGDTENMEVMAAKYQKLGSKPEFQNLADSCLFLATWDDHDYGANDSGEEYPMKAESKEVFLNFWNDPNEAERNSHTGIYNSYYYGNEGNRLQVIVLDTRTFRTPLLKKKLIPIRKYKINNDPNASILGNEQWKWLEEQLTKTADLRIIVSSIQFCISHNGFEAWANYPLQQEKLLDLIKSNQVNGVCFISGDVHYGELSVINKEEQYPIYDLTSSGITQSYKVVKKNKNRIGDAFTKNNYGFLNIDWDKKQVAIGIKDIDDNSHLTKTISFSEISF